MSLLVTHKLMKDEDFRGRVTVAIYKAAVAVMNEDPPAEGATEKQKRIWRARRGFAQDIYVDPYAMTGRFMWQVCANPSIVSAADAQGTADHTLVPDTDIEYVIASEYDVIARLAKGETAD